MEGYKIVGDYRLSPNKVQKHDKSYINYDTGRNHNNHEVSKTKSI